MQVGSPGFKDRLQDLDAYVGATNRSRQRLVKAVAAENEYFIILSFDVSQAFAKGLSCEEFSRLIGTACRAVQLDVPRLDSECLEQIKESENFNPMKETLHMLKPMYGLRDAPRAWRNKLQQVLEQLQSC